jgi:hypothetical protein
MFDESLLLSLGLVIIVFIVCIFLVIFAPKPINFFDVNLYTAELDKLIKQDDLVLENSVLLDVIDEDITDVTTLEKITRYKNMGEMTWMLWPDNSVVSGKVYIAPIFIEGKFEESNAGRFSSLLNAIKDIPDIKSLYFIKIDVNSSFIKHKGYKSMSNDTLRYLYCFNSYCYNETESGLWIGGEAKKLIQGSSIIYDSSKEHSLYNNTANDIMYLIVDFIRPESVPVGYSDNEAFLKLDF